MSDLVPTTTLTPAAPEASTSGNLVQRSAEDRKSALASSIAQHVSRGWRVESQSDYTAVIAKGNRPNHLLHLLLTVFTLSAWVFVWVGVAILGGEKRKTITVDAYGQTLVQG